MIAKISDKLLIITLSLIIFAIFLGWAPARAEELATTTITTTVLMSDSATDTPYAEVITSTQRQLISEPNIRVGLYVAKEPVQFLSEFDYDVYAGEEWRGVLPARNLAKLSYKNKVYNLTSAAINFSSENKIRLVSKNSDSYFSLLNNPRRIAGRGANTNFNVYRGTLEYWYSPKSKAPYVINELPLEQYAAGVTETDNGAPYEYIKALQTAARTYAYTNISSKPPTEKRLFDVYASTVDQLYLGYTSEVMMPKVAQATAETAGLMVTYQGIPAATYYFGHSNGKTRAGKQPWLKSVKAPYDKGKKMWGHGIGMSCADALAHARKLGWNSEKILKYYYTGVEVERVY